MNQMRKKRISGVLLGLLLAALLCTTAFAAEGSLKLKSTDGVVGERFAVGNMFPGDAVTQDYKVSVSHRNPVDIYFQATVRAESVPLNEVLKLKVELPEKGEILYDGLMAMNKTEKVTLPVGENGLTYRLTAYLDTGVGNHYQNKTLVADFNWWYEEQPGAGDGSWDGTGGGSDGGGNYNPGGPAPADVKVLGEVFLDGKPAEGRGYVFVLTDEDGNILQRVQNEGGMIKFRPIVQEHPGTYIYYIRAAEALDSESILDDAVYKVIVTVTQENGVLVTKIKYEKDGEPYNAGLPRFYNVSKGSGQPGGPGYAEGHNVHVKVVAEVFQDNKYPSDEQFFFALYDQVGGVMQTATHKSGIVEFDHIVLSGVGTHEFYIRQIAGTDPTIVYDAAEYKITVNVSVAEQNGRFVVAVLLEKDGEPYMRIPQFFNESAADASAETGYEPVRVKLMAEKVLDGRYPRGDKYSFVLCNLYGEVLQTVRNRDGLVEFDSFGLTRPGTYIYYIRELTGTDSNIDYDVSEYKAIVTVYAENGALVAEVAHEKNGAPYDPLPRFVNTTTPDEEASTVPPAMGMDEPAATPDNPKVEGRDSVSTAAYAGGGALALLLAAAYVIYRAKGGV